MSLRPGPGQPADSEAAAAAATPWRAPRLRVGHGLERCCAPAPRRRTVTHQAVSKLIAVRACADSACEFSILIFIDGARAVIAGVQSG